MKMDNQYSPLIRQLGIELPIIGGPMYPCSNPELVAAVSEAGGIGVVQPISLTYVHGYDFREGLRHIRQFTNKPIGLNALIERSSKKYHQSMVRWVEIALEEGIRFFVTSLGKPNWVVRRVQKVGGVVYHDVTERKWALKAVDAGVDGLIAVNNRAGGHAGRKTHQMLFQELHDLNLPLICAGGVSTADQFRDVLELGYHGVQMGTRFIATDECSASTAYKQAIIAAGESDIVLSERITGIPVALIQTPYVRRIGTRAGFIARWMLKGGVTKTIMRTLYALTSLWKLKRALLHATGKMEFWQAGKSVGDINTIQSVKEIMAGFKRVFDKFS
ncbi:MAG: nitronate monooxygenase [Gammaproteobacteria bacterium]|nr:nitronate monooxygenase [Gammaproteobacteria bacterium]